MLCSKDFYRPTKYNGETKTQLWMSTIADSHDIHCSCETPFAHLLCSLFPPGHKDRKLTIEQIIWRDFKELQKCHSSGEGATATGVPGTSGEDSKGDGAPGEDPFAGEEGIEELCAAARDAEEQR